MTEQEKKIKEIAIMPTQEMNWHDTKEMAIMLARSGYFRDAATADKAVAKILAGREMGFGPMASLRGIYVDPRGNISIGADLLAKAVKRSGRYDYRVIALDEKECIIRFFENQEPLGDSSLTMTQAKAAKMDQQWDKQANGWKPKATWQSYPRNMLFARTLSNGVKWFCPDASMITVYTPDELTPTEDQPDIITVTPTPLTEPESPEPLQSDIHWIDTFTSGGKTVRAMFWARYKGDMKLTEDEVHKALGVEHIRDFSGTMADANDAILAYIDEQIEAETAEAPPESPEEPPSEDIPF